MGIMDRARAAVRAFSGSEAGAVAAADGMNDPGGFTVLNLLGGAGGVSIGEQEAMSLPAVLRALEVLCGLFAMTPVHYYQRQGDEKTRVDDASVAKIFRERPNGVQHPFLFKELMLGDLVMRGRFGSYIHRNALYQPSALTRLDPGGIAASTHWDRTDGLEAFYDVLLPDGSQERLTRNDAWVVPGFSRNGLLGIDRLHLLCDTIEAARSTSAFARRFWENNAQPSTILTTKAKVDAAEKTRMRTDWMARFSGSRNAGAVAVLDQEMDAKFLAHDNAKSQYIEVRSFYVVEVARALGVPPHVVFELSRATFSNIEQQSLELILYSMMFHYERVASAMTFQFAESGYFFEFAPEALMKGDLLSRYQAYGLAIDKGILNPNEVRRRENLNDRDGGDEYRVGSGSMLEGEQIAPADHRPPEPDPKPKPKKAAGDDTDQEDEA